MKELSSFIKMLVATCIAFILVSGLTIFIFTHPQKKEKAVPASEGANFIALKESADVAEIENKIFTSERAYVAKSFSEDPSKIWETLESYDTVILGDSRAASFWGYEYMDQQHALANISQTINNIPEYYDEIETINPKAIVISYGINDVGLGLAPNGTEYAKAIHEHMKKLKEFAPDAKMIMNSIIPALPFNYDRSPSWSRIPDWNKEMAEYCKENGLIFLDITSLCEEHQDLYTSDGVHMKYDFYPYWGSAIASLLVK